MPESGERKQPPSKEVTSATDNSNENFAAAIVAQVSQPLVVLDGSFRVKVANPAFLEQLDALPEGTVGRQPHELGNGQWDIPELRRLLEEVLSQHARVQDFRVVNEFERIGRKVMLINATRMSTPGAPDCILLAISDVTEREQLRFDLEGRREFAEKLIDSVREGLVVLGWDLRAHSANLSFYQTFHVDPAETEAHLIYKLGNGQ